jgi:hypothetical protein
MPQCRRNCLQVIDQQQRLQIHADFWSLSYTDRKRWISQRLERTTPNRRRPKHKEPRSWSERKYTFVNREGVTTQVCKQFFLSTVGLKSDMFITTLCRTTPRGSATPPPNKLSDATENEMSDHIESYHPTIPHYRRAHVPNRRYLPPEVTVQAMYDDFKQKHPLIKASLTCYRRLIHKKNISFAKLDDERFICVLESYQHLFFGDIELMELN